MESPTTTGTDAAPTSAPRRRTRRKCPIDCPCLCHDTGGGSHTHQGRPCPTKSGEAVLDDWVSNTEPGYDEIVARFAR